MEPGLFTNQGKKLILIALLLLGVSMLVGKEDDPGVLAAAQRDGMAGDPGSQGPPPAAFAQPAQAAMPPAPAPPVQNQMAVVAPPPPSTGGPAPAAAPSPAETVYASGEDLIDSAQGFDPTPMLDPTPPQ